MKLSSQSLAHDAPIPDAFAFAKPDPTTRATFSDNVSPQLAWSDVPEGCRSFVIACVDVDVPTIGDDVNQEGRTVPADLPRTEFTHWIMIDVASDCRSLDEGACGRGVVPRGKASPPGPAPSRQGQNDYTSWFAGDPEMGGTYRGYDGPGPPWNDERLHHYLFQIHALDVERVAVEGDFTLADVRAAIEGHVLASAELVGTYTNNPVLRG